MKAFLKLIGNGILYVILSPIIAAIFAVFILYALAMTLFYLLMWPFNYFSGKGNLKDKETIELEARKAAKIGEQTSQNNMVNHYPPQGTYTQPQQFTPPQQQYNPYAQQQNTFTPQQNPYSQPQQQYNPYAQQHSPFPGQQQQPTQQQPTQYNPFTNQNNNGGNNR